MVTAGGLVACGTELNPLPGPPVVETDAASDVKLSSGTLHGTVNPNGGATTSWFEWGQDPTFTVSNSTAVQSVGSGTNSITVNELLNPLTPGRTYYYRVVGQNDSGTAYGAGMSFATPVPQAPVVTTNGPGVITQTGCSFNGTVNTNGAATTGWFEWGPDASYGTTTTAQPLGNGTTDVALSQPISGLTPDTPYHYRAAAENAAGTVFGQDDVCTTLAATTDPPVVTTEPATGITPTAVTMNGTINPHGADAFGRFEWGVTAAYGNVTAEQYMGNGSAIIPFSLRLTGLAPSTDYHFRAIGRGDGEATGQDQSLTTPTAAIPSRLYLSDDESGPAAHDQIIVIDPNPTVHNDGTNTDDPNPDYNQQVGSVAITGKNPAELAAHPDGSTVYAMVGTNLSVIDVLANAELTSLPGAGDLFHHLVVAPDGKKLYLAYRTGSGTLNIKVFDVSTPQAPTVLLTITDPIFNGCYAPLGLAIRPDGSQLYLACRTTNSALPDRFYMVNTASNTPTLTATFTRDSTNAFTINAFAIKPDGSQVYVARTDNGTGSKVEVFDGTSGAQVQSIALPSGALPRAGVVSPDGSRLYVVDQSKGIHVIDAGSNTYLLTTAQTTSRGFDIGITPDGARLYTTLLGSVFANATGTNSWIATITGTFTGATNLALTPGHS